MKITQSNLSNHVLAFKEAYPPLIRASGVFYSNYSINFLAFLSFIKEGKIIDFF